MFACEHEDVVPDLITTAKALAGGMPLAAVTGRAELMDAVPAGGLGGTYAGNPVACAAALGALETIEQREPGRAGSRDRGARDAAAPSARRPGLHRRRGPRPRRHARHRVRQAGHHGAGARDRARPSRPSAIARAS